MGHLEFHYSFTDHHNQYFVAAESFVEFVDHLTFKRSGRVIFFCTQFFVQTFNRVQHIFLCEIAAFYLRIIKVELKSHYYNTWSTKIKKEVSAFDKKVGEFPAGSKLD